jgi:ferredoxin--NADP+ reductase
MSIIKDPDTYEAFDRVILTHGTRYVSELAYQTRIINELPENEFFGEQVRQKLLYYPTVTREAFHTQGRITDALRTGKLTHDLGLPPLNLEQDRFMICGSPSMLKDTCEILDAMGFVEARHGEQGHYVIERAFVES